LIHSRYQGRIIWLQVYLQQQSHRLQVIPTFF
jgi:hypothetical protein